MATEQKKHNKNTKKNKKYTENRETGSYKFMCVANTKHSLINEKQTNTKHQ